MREHTSYRLAEYKIIENAYGDIYWETHFGLGALKKGKCFISGNILFIEPKHTEVPGFLKGEFLDHLKRLPKWEKTKYYCSSYKRLKCKTKEKNPPKIFKTDRYDRGASKNNRSPRKNSSQNTGRMGQEIAPGDICYRLGRYEIIENNNDELFWKTASASGRMKEGKCDINGDILFIGPAEAEKSGPVKKHFMLRLAVLPSWEKTVYYCPSFAVYHCATGAICRRFGDTNKHELRESGGVTAVKQSFHSARKIRRPTALKVGFEPYIKAFFGFCKQAAIIILIAAFWSGKTICRITRWGIAGWKQFRD